MIDDSTDVSGLLATWREQCSRQIPGDDLESKVALWHELFANYDTQRLGPAPIWKPEPGDQPTTHLANWMDDLGLSEVAAFHQWSVENRELFWSQAIERLSIQWSRPPDSVVDLSRGVARAQWFPGAELDLVEQCLAGPDDRVMLTIGKSDGSIESVTAGGLRRRVQQTAKGLLAAGFQNGDAIAIIMPMNLDAVVAYLAVLKAGGFVVSIPESFAPPEIATRLRIAQAAGVFTVDQFSRAGKTIGLGTRVAVARQQLTSEQKPRLIVANLENLPPGLLLPEDLSWDDSFGGDVPDRWLTDRLGIFASSHRINVLFSSGTTGDPKAIPWTQVTAFKCAVDGMLLQDLNDSDVVAWPTSLGWMMGPWLLFAAWLNRAQVAIYDDAPTSSGFVDFIAKSRVTMLGVIPTIVRHWRHGRLLEHADWSAIRRFSSTGEASQVDDMVYLSAATGCKPIIEYCGGTEIGGGYISSTMNQTNSPAAFSTVAFGLDMKILDSQGTEAAEGEAFLVPPSVGLSTDLLNRDHDRTYYKGTPRVADAEVLRRHGDRFRRYENGVFVAGGRVDDTMNLGGIKTSSAELERAMNRVAGVHETAAIACPAPEGGPDRLVVFVVLSADSKATPPSKDQDLVDQFNRVLKEQVNPLFRVAEVRVIKALPRTASNKVMRRKLRELIDSREAN